jgi:hypothetical protein
VGIKIYIFWDITPCSPLKINPFWAGGYASVSYARKPSIEANSKEGKDRTLSVFHLTIFSVN